MPPLWVKYSNSVGPVPNYPTVLRLQYEHSMFRSLSPEDHFVVELIEGCDFGKEGTRDMAKGMEIDAVDAFDDEVDEVCDCGVVYLSYERKSI